MRGYLQSDILIDSEGFHYVHVRAEDGSTEIIYLDHPDDDRRSDCECVWSHLGIWAWIYRSEYCPNIHIDDEVMHLLQHRLGMERGLRRLMND